MPDIDVYGDIIDPDSVERWVQDTLKAWLPGHLGHQERRRPDVQEMLEAIGEEHLPQPRSWPRVSDFDPELEERLPAVTIVNTGAPRIERDRGKVRKFWRIEVAVAVAGKDEDEARLLASLYLAAIFGALEQGDPTLGGNVERCYCVGPDDYAYGITEKGAQRAIYGTAFEVIVHNALDTRKGPAEPPEDPYEPPASPPSLIEADIEITTTWPEETP